MSPRTRLASVFLVLLASAQIWTQGCAAHHVNPSARPLAIAAYPSLGLAPRDVTISVRIDHDRDARAWCVVLVQGDIPVQRTCADHDGTRFKSISFPRVGGGPTVAALAVVFGDGHVESVSTTFCFVSVEGECD